MKFYVKRISMKEVKNLVEDGDWKAEDTVSMFVVNSFDGKTIQVFGCGYYGSYGEEGTNVEIINGSNGKKMFAGEIVEYSDLGKFVKGVNTYFLV